MKKVVILSGVAALFLGACTSTGGGSLKSTEDSLAYAMGLDMGSYIQNMDTMLDANLNLAGDRKSDAGCCQERYFRDEQGGRL